METIAKLALPPHPSLNPAKTRGESGSPSLGVALTIGQALTVEQEPPDSPRLRRSIRGPRRCDVAGMSLRPIVLL